MCGVCQGGNRELAAFDAVGDVGVQLAAGGAPVITIKGASALRDEDVAAALDEAGDYRLAGSARWTPRTTTEMKLR